MSEFSAKGGGGGGGGEAVEHPGSLSVAASLIVRGYCYVSVCRHVLSSSCSMLECSHGLADVKGLEIGKTYSNIKHRKQNLIIFTHLAFCTIHLFHSSVLKIKESGTTSLMFIVRWWRCWLCLSI